MRCTARGLSRGCGTPLAFAAVAPGEVVADLGCGGGIDVLLAAGRVGPEGRVTGVDMTPGMIERARGSVAEAGVADQSFLVVADIRRTGLPDASVDMVISNCMINLVPDKEAVYSEIVRVLRPGGRIANSDIAVRGPVALKLSARFQASWAGCLGGAVPELDYLQIVSSAGLSEATVVARHPLGAGELRAVSCCPGEEYTTPPAAADLAAVADKE